MKIESKVVLFSSMNIVIHNCLIIILVMQLSNNNCGQPAGALHFLDLDAKIKTSLVIFEPVRAFVILIGSFGEEWCGNEKTN